MKIKIVFKSGAIVDCEVETLGCRNNCEGGIGRLEWTPSDNGVSLVTLDIKDISAIFKVAD